MDVQWTEGEESASHVFLLVLSGTSGSAGRNPIDHVKTEGKTFDRKRSDVFLFYANLTERAKIEKYYQKWYKKGIKMLGDRQKVPENGHSYQEVYE